MITNKTIYNKLRSHILKNGTKPVNETQLLEIAGFGAKEKSVKKNYNKVKDSVNG